MLKALLNLEHCMNAYGDVNNNILTTQFIGCSIYIDYGVQLTSHTDICPHNVLKYYNTNLYANSSIMKCRKHLSINSSTYTYLASLYF